MLGQLVNPPRKNTAYGPLLPVIHKNYLKLIKELNVIKLRVKVMKLLEENRGRNHPDLDLGNDS